MVLGDCTIGENVGGLAEPVEISEDEPFVLNPVEFVLTSTLESIALPHDVVARLERKSSLGSRIDVLIHPTAGHIDPGWYRHLILELSNVTKLPVTLYYKIATSRVSFLHLTSPAERVYGFSGLRSKYQGRKELTASRYHKEFVNEGGRC